jgi:ParB family chromosome partitioning protein
MSNVQKVLIASIDPPAFNSRVKPDDANIAELATSFTKQGQQSPIKVEPKESNGMGVEGRRYELVFGSRRLAAAKSLGWTEIDAEISEPTDAPTRVLLNAIENVQRKNLTTFELGRLFAEMRAQHFKGKEIASELGFSESHISNVATCFEGLPPEIKLRWSEEHPAADVSFMRTLVNYKDDKGKTKGRTPDEMIALWKERAESLEAITGEPEEDEDDDDADDSDDKDGKTKKVATPPYKVPTARYKAVLAALRTNKSPKVATDVVRFLVGDIQKVQGLTIEGEDRTSPGQAKVNAQIEARRRGK